MKDIYFKVILGDAQTISLGITDSKRNGILLCGDIPLGDPRDLQSWNIDEKCARNVLNSIFSAFPELKEEL